MNLYTVLIVALLPNDTQHFNQALIYGDSEDQAISASVNHFNSEYPDEEITNTAALLIPSHVMRDTLAQQGNRVNDEHN